MFHGLWGGLVCRLLLALRTAVEGNGVYPVWAIKKGSVAFYSHQISCVLPELGLLLAKGGTEECSRSFCSRHEWECKPGLWLYVAGHLIGKVQPVVNDVTLGRGIPPKGPRRDVVLVLTWYTPYGCNPKRQHLWTCRYTQEVVTATIKGWWVHPEFRDPAYGSALLLFTDREGNHAAVMRQIEPAPPRSTCSLAISLPYLIQQGDGNLA